MLPVVHRSHWTIYGVRYRFNTTSTADRARGSAEYAKGHAPVTDVDSARGVYGITTAAELVGMGVQNLRAYEARGLLEPERTPGGTRRYSADDLERLRHIGDLLLAGLNLAGIAMVLDLETQNAQLRAGR
jgi:hypothetical protein